MKSNRYIRVLTLIISSGIIFSIFCTIVAISIAILAPAFARESLSTNSNGIVLQLAVAGMIAGFIIGAGTMTIIMLFASIAHWASPSSKS